MVHDIDAIDGASTHGLHCVIAREAINIIIYIENPRIEQPRKLASLAINIYNYIENPRIEQPRKLASLAIIIPEQCTSQLV